MKKFFILLAFLLPFAVQGQHLDKIKFDTQAHDFGEISESDGPVTHEFQFVNITGDSLRITHVRASCGCTTPAWTREPIAPGDTGLVQAQYNPYNRPGPFNKTLSVNFDILDEPVTLFIRGKVTPKTGPAAEEYRHAIGGIRLKYATFNLGKVYTTEEPTEKRFPVYNDSDTVITFTEEVEKPAFVDVSIEPSSIAPGETAELVIRYDAKAKDDLGFSSDNITFFTDEEEEASRKSVSLYATIEEYFPPMTAEEMKKAPHLKITDPLYDFDDISEGVQVSTEFTLTNTGQSNLNIRQVKGNCACVSAEVNKTDLAPGETALVKVTFDSSQRKGNQQKSITVYSNDPMAPAQRMTIRARVKSN